MRMPSTLGMGYDRLSLMHNTTVFAQQKGRVMNRRAFFSAGTAAAAGMMLSRSALAHAQGFSVGPEPVRYPSTVWKVLDERFRKYMIGNTPLVREWTGGLWAEGPAWNGVGTFRGVQRHSEQRPDAMGRGDGKNHGAADAFEFFERQHLRLAGPSDFVRTRDREGGALRISEANRPCWPRHTTASGSTRRTTLSCIRTAAASCLAIRATAAIVYYEGTVRELELPTSVYHIDAQNGRLTRLSDEILKPQRVVLFSRLPFPLCRGHRADTLTRVKKRSHQVGCPGQRRPPHQPPRVRDA